MTFNYDKDSILAVRRTGTSDDPYISITQDVVVKNGLVQLSEIPDTLSRVKVTGDGQEWYEVTSGALEGTEYKVSYQQGYVEFNPVHDGKILTFMYMGTGGVFISADRIWTDVDGRSVIETLKDVIDEGESAIENLKDINKAIDDAEFATNAANDAATTTKLNYLSPVVSYSNISSTYPSPKLGDVVQVTETNDWYRYDGTGWKIIQNLNLTGYETTASVNSKIDSVTAQLAEVAYSINNFSSMVVDEDWTDAINQANDLGREIYFPEGTFTYKSGELLLNKGTIFKGAGVSKTTLKIDVSDTYSYIFMLNLFSGIEDIKIEILNNYSGSAILIEPAYASYLNNNANINSKTFFLNNVVVSFPFKSGFGVGLDVQISNFHNETLFDSTVAQNYLQYLEINNFEVKYGYKAINVTMHQKDSGVISPLWFTASKLEKILVYRCGYGIYFEMINETTTNLATTGDLQFNSVEVQCAPANYLGSTPDQTVPIYIKGISTRKPAITFNDLSIWDSNNGESGKLTNANVKINNLMMGYSVKNNTPNYKKGFYIENSSLSVDGDGELSFTSDNGNVSVLRYMDGGFRLLNTPEENGWDSNTQLYHDNTTGVETNTFLKNINKNNLETAKIKMGRGRNFKGVRNNYGIFDVTVSDHNGNSRPVVNAGEVGLYSTSRFRDLGFYVGMGAYIVFERTLLDVPQSASYQTVTIPIKETYTSMPFLVSCNFEPSSSSGDSNYDVTIREAFVTDKNNVTVRLKHNKEGIISLRFNLVICGHKDVDELT